jgi:sigma-B regulation protein RsbU (phosphoserine phosphatase)
MVDDFTELSKILKVAIESEIATQRMYAKYSEEVSEPEMKRFLNYLAEYEAMHQRFLEAELKALTIAQNDKKGRPSNWLKLLRDEFNTRSAVAVPEIDENPDIGSEQCKLNLSVTEHIAKILEDANEELLQQQIRHEQELVIAADIQKKLLPQELPQNTGLQIAASNTMARYVGGDYYDLITNQQGQLSLIIADSMGKGISAALLMTTVRAIWREGSAVNSSSPGDILKTINRAVYTDLQSTGSFVTMFSGLYEPKTSIFRYSNAGHNPSILLPASVSEYKALDIGGMPVGIIPDAKFPNAEILLREGDIIVMYTDGIVEADNGKDELFGLERLCNVVDKNRDSDAEEVREAILSEVDSYTDGSLLADDTTVVVLKKVNL